MGGSVGDDNYGIAHNGAVIYKCKTREIIYDKRLDNKIALEIIKDLKDSNLNPIVYIDTVAYSDITVDENIKGYEERALITITIIDNLLDIKEDVTKILVRDERDVLENSYNKFIKKYKEDDFNIFFTAINLLEFTSLDATKGKALEYLAKYLNIEIENTISSGDNYNDISLIESAGFGIAVKNAVPKLKNIANYVTENDCSNNAVAEIINKFILK